MQTAEAHGGCAELRGGFNFLRRVCISISQRASACPLCASAKLFHFQKAILQKNANRRVSRRIRGVTQRFLLFAQDMYIEFLSAPQRVLCAPQRNSSISKTRLKLIQTAEARGGFNFLRRVCISISQRASALPLCASAKLFHFHKAILQKNANRRGSRRFTRSYAEVFIVCAGYAYGVSQRASACPLCASAKLFHFRYSSEINANRRGSRRLRGVTRRKDFISL